MGKEQFKRIHLSVLDSVGIGESPDANVFGDEAADTLGHIADAMEGFHMPNMAKLGLSNIRRIEGVPVADKPLAIVTERCKRHPSAKTR